MEGLRGMILAAGLLMYRTPNNSELTQVCEAVGGRDIVRDAKRAFAELKSLGDEVEKIMG